MGCLDCAAVSTLSPCTSLSLACSQPSARLLRQWRRLPNAANADRTAFCRAQALPERGVRKRREDAGIPVSEELADTSKLSQQLAGLGNRRRRRQPIFDEEEPPPPIKTDANSQPVSSDLSNATLRERGSERVVATESAQSGRENMQAEAHSSNVEEPSWWPDFTRGLENFSGVVNSRDAELVGALLTVGWKAQVRKSSKLSLCLFLVFSWV